VNDKEKRIKEERTIEATKKDLMGASGKLGLIVKYMGQLITYHSQDFSTGNWLHPEENDLDVNPYELKGGTSEEINNQIPTIYGDNFMGPVTGPEWREPPEMDYAYTEHRGWVFDGLNRGMHIEIQYLEYENVLTTTYKGYLVYKETAGELDTYVPLDEWESKINRLHTVAKEIRKRKNKKERIKEIKEAEINKKSWLQRMRLKWGF